MTNLTRSNFQAHPFHIVSPSPGPQFYSDILRAYFLRAYDSLEWGLQSPPKPHSFVSLPLQSGVPYLPAELVSMIGAFIEVTSQREIQDIMVNMLGVYSGIEDLHYIWDLDFIRPRAIPLDSTAFYLAEYDLICDRTSEALRLTGDSIHTIAKWEANTVLLYKGDLYNQVYSLTVEAGTNINTLPNTMGLTKTTQEPLSICKTVLNMMTDHKLALRRIEMVKDARHNMSMFMHLPYPDPVAIARDENVEMFRQLPFPDLSDVGA